VELDIGIEACKHELTLANFRHTIASVPTTFEAAFARVKEWVANFKANEKFYLSQAYLV